MKAIELLGLLLSSTPQPLPEPDALDRAALSDRSAALLERLAQAALASGADELEELLDTLLDAEVYAELRMTFAKAGPSRRRSGSDPEAGAGELGDARALMHELADLFDQLPTTALRSAADDANLFAQASAALANPQLPSLIRERLRASLLAGLASMLDAAARAPEASPALAELGQFVEALAPRWLAWARSSFELALAAASWVRPGIVFELGHERFADESVFLAVAAVVDDHPDCPGAELLDPGLLGAEVGASAGALRASPRLRTTE